MMRARILALFLAGVSVACAGRTRAPEGLDPASVFELRGNHDLDDTRLFDRVREVIQLPAERAPTKAEVDDAAYVMEELYRELGYPDARVDYELRDEGAGGIRALFVVTEGPRVALQALEFHGNEAFSDEELRVLLPNPEYYVRSYLEELTDEISDLYYASGFLRVDVSEPQARVDEELDTASVSVSIAEGPRFVLRDVQIEGDLLDAEERLAEAYTERLEKAFVPSVTLAIRARIRDTLSGEGHPDSEVVVEQTLDEETGDVRLAFEVTPGPRVTISSVRVEGNEHTRAELILERIQIEPGSLYDSRKIRSAFQAIYRSGLFHRVQIDLEEEEGEERTLVVRVEEAPSLEFFIEPGFGSYEGPRIKAGVTELNTMGTGLQLGLTGNASTKDVRGEVRLTEPWLFEDTSGSTNVFWNWREEPSFEVTEIGTGVSLTKRWSEDLSMTSEYGFVSSNVKSSDLDDSSFQDLVEDVDVSSVSHSVSYNTTNDFLRPTVGGRTRGVVEYAAKVFGSGIDFLAGRASHAHYLSLSETTTLAMRVETGIIQPLDGETIPVQLRYFNGGENSVRSFKEDELGPKDAGDDPIGGEAFNLANLELRQELAGRFSGALFVDVGNVSRDLSDYFSFEDGGAALGVGLRYWLPVGPIRVDFGFNPDPKDDEDDFVIHVAVGMAF